MKLFRIFAAGALSYVAYRAWQRRQATPPPSGGTLPDTGARTAPHGDPVLDDEALDEVSLGSGGQSSRSFGAP